MKYEESVANINQDGKQSICLKLKPLVQKFLELLQDKDLLMESGSDEFANLLVSCILIIDGQCCEGDYMITTDEDEEHDEQAFKETILEHDWEPKPTERQLKEAWMLLRPFVTKEVVTWG